MTLLTLRPRRKTALFQRQTSEDIYSSKNSPRKTHRRTPSGWLTISVSKSTEGDVSHMSSTANDDANATDALNMCWSSSGSDTFLPLHYLDTNNDYSQERKSEGQALGRGSDERDGRSMSAHELEDLIRQLSFSPSQETKKRTNTADTDTSSSSSYDSPDMHDYKQTMSPVGVEFKDVGYLRRCPSSPLMGLKFLPD
mmetsp:Transcript_6134/g.9567  ORF Transcript_6134/g.9567 Transcript_6134/m.9567 type:complete len:197 (-) Transcript_6134:138-728(-)|eukprot:CAMPEP_0201728208 /NCGR_PEP_ID=MMETSP0593-20130828/15115_1 /ASSEMBLY_ACC=CAM_ASM_000672 /TAXON_ID=267983 /ORGANISM="Skeletonema japonicum, Strain CCMP2506" /LENGTH=196 /DNA_ID=CAMNT_0048220251 /DNA_START=31 /DNA_END=621 /DNA_ORIENTATION=+